MDLILMFICIFPFVCRISLVLHHQGLRGNIMRRDFEEKFDLIVDANDSILERVVRAILSTI
jgi:hypothetical protein